MAQDPEEVCKQCGHLFDPHVLVAVHLEHMHGKDDVPTAGYMVCPEPNCLCWSTWSVGDMYTKEEVTEFVAQWVEETGIPATSLEKIREQRK